MNFLIIGASGLLGFELLNEILIHDDNFVYSLSKQPILLKNKRHVNFISTIEQFDLNVLENKNIDIIYYLAQSNKFREFPESSLDVFDVNIKGPLQIIDWALKKNIKSFIYASSGGIYSEEISLKENTKIKLENNLGFYLNSKICAEIIISNYKDFFESLIILRPFFIYGERQKKDMLMPRLISMVKNDLQVTLDGPDGIKLNPIYVKDAAIAAYNAKSIKGYHKINIAGNEVFTLKEIVKIISEKMNKDVTIIETKNKPKYLVGDIAKMKRILHKPEFDFNKGISNLINDQ